MIMLFANRIRRLREEQQQFQQQQFQRQLASAFEIDSPMYSEIERGKCPENDYKLFHMQDYFLWMNKNSLLFGWRIK